MKMKKLYFILILLCSTLSLSQSPHVEWVKILGSAYNDAATTVIETSDNGFLVLGHAGGAGGDVSMNNGFNDFWIVKLTSQGAVQWEKNYGGSGDDYGYCGVQTSDGGFIIGGRTGSNDGDVSSYFSSYDGWLIKLDQDGDLEWEKNYGGNQIDFIQEVIQTPDGGYIFGGQTESSDEDISTNYGEFDIWVVKIDDTGAIEWEKNFGGSYKDFFGSINLTNDNGYVITGQTNSIDHDISENQGQFDLLVYKLDANGDIVWLDTFGGSLDEWAVKIIETSDGNFLIGANTDSNDGDVSEQKGNGDYWLIKLNQNGGLLWEKTFGGSRIDRLSTFIETNDSGFSIVGTSQSVDGDIENGTTGIDCWLLKINSNGVIEWSKNFVEFLSEKSADIKQTSDNGFVIAGNVINNSWEDYWIMKLGPAGSLPQFSDNKTRIFPNPNSGSFTIESRKPLTVEIYNSLGREIFSKRIIPGTNQLRVDNIESGIYMLHAIDQEGLRDTRRVLILD